MNNKFVYTKTNYFTNHIYIKCDYVYKVKHELELTFLRE